MKKTAAKKEGVGHAGNLPAYTPGPWVQYPNSDGIRVSARDDDHFIALVSKEGNARLISAAPELLEALTGLFQHCAMVHKHWGDNSNQGEADAAIAKAHAVIAKAEGR